MGIWDEAKNEAKKAWQESAPEAKQRPAKDDQSSEVPPSTWLPPRGGDERPSERVAAEGGRSKGAWKGWVGGIVVVLFLVSLFTGGQEKKTDGASKPQAAAAPVDKPATATTSAVKTSTPKPKPKPAGRRHRSISMPARARSKRRSMSTSLPTGHSSAKARR